MPNSQPKTLEDAMNRISTAAAAGILGVSGATIRNWSRAGHLQPVSVRPTTFLRSDVLALKERIRTNRFSKLRKRANKSAAERLEDHSRRDAKIAAALAAFAQSLANDSVDPARTVFAAALQYLQKAGEAVLPPAPIRFDAVVWRRPSLGRVMRRWFNRIGDPVHTLAPEAVAAFLAWTDCDDPIGQLNESLAAAGKKSRTGSFLTPPEVIEQSLAECDPYPETFLDPCCGTGRYLTHAAARFGLAPENVFGFDADPTSVDIACINLLLAYPDKDFDPQIRCLDSLRDLATGGNGCDSNFLIGRIDAIATNPPWGGCKNTTWSKASAATVKSGESFSLFLEKSLRLLRPGGRLSFILPESILKIKAHSDIRGLLLNETHICKISLLGRVFADVFTPVVRLDAIKNPPPEEWNVSVFCDGRRYHAPQKRFAANINQTFDVAVSPRDEQIMARLFSIPHQTLAQNAEWALGVVTGDNGRWVLDAPRDGSEPILRGRDVFKYAPREPRSHIVFQPGSFQQVAPERLYRAPEKLVYRFVSDHLVFAYDNKGLLTLNSANILIPRLPGYSIKYALAFLNSQVFQYIFTKRFQTRKILRGDLKTLPFPRLSLPEAQAIERQVELCMTGEYEPADALDRMIYRAFNLEENEITELENGLNAPSGRVIL